MYLLAAAVVRGSKDVIPDSSRHPEINFRNSVVNLVMHSKFAIPTLGKLKMMMNVMEDAVKEEPCCQSGDETQNIWNFEIAAEDEPHE